MATRLISFLIIVWKVIMYYINTNIICGKQHCVLFPHDEAYLLILRRSYDIKLQKAGRFGAKCTKFIPFA